MGILRQWGPRYSSSRLVTVPVEMGNGSKRPLRRYRRLRNPPPGALFETLDKKYPDAGLALCCGPSGKVLIDIDSPDKAILKEARNRFGITPVTVCTPSRGYHLWYSSAGVTINCRNLRGEGLPIDVKAQGGLGIVPPSINGRMGTAYVYLGGPVEDFIDALVAAPAINAAPPIRARNGMPEGRRAASCSTPYENLPDAKPATTNC